MIATEELRIGNYCYHSSNKNKVIQCKLLAPGKSYYEPIPLTEEWLLSFGFYFVGIHAVDSMVYRKEHKGVIYQFILGEKYEAENPNCGTFGVYSPTEIIPFPSENDPDRSELFMEALQNFSWHNKYVHHLQNLWFGTTKEELPFRAL